MKFNGPVDHSGERVMSVGDPFDPDDATNKAYVDQILTVAQPDTASTTSVASSIVSVALLAANAARKGAVIWNDSAATLYVKFGTGASMTSATYLLGSGAILELPPPVYVGDIAGVWDAATGNARITEVW